MWVLGQLGGEVPTCPWVSAGSPEACRPAADRTGWALLPSDEQMCPGMWNSRWELLSFGPEAGHVREDSQGTEQPGPAWHADVVEQGAALRRGGGAGPLLAPLPACAPTPWLLGNHTIFGKVVDDASKRVVDAIVGAPTGRNDKPIEDITIDAVTIAE